MAIISKFNNQSNDDLVNEKIRFKEVLVMPELDDFNSFVRKRKISIWKWIKDVSATDAFMVFDRKDPMPFWVALKQYIGRGIRKVIK